MGVAPIKVQLGCLELLCKDSNLRLSLSSAAQLTASKEDDTDISIVPTADSLSSRYDRKWWVRKAQNYSLIFEIRTNVEGNPLPGQAIGQKVASRLRHAKVWSTLQLTVLSIEVTSTSRTGAEILTISFDYDDAQSLSSQKRLHKLAQGVPSHDIRPPVGIPCVALQAVHLVASISGPQGPDMSHQPTNSEAGPLHQQYCDGKHHTLVHNEVNTEGEETALVSMSAPNLYPTPPSSQEVLSECSAPHTVNACHNHVLRLLEAGLRLAICDSPTRLPTSITTRSNESFHSLSDVLPELWSPNYLPRVAGRRILLPTIAHAFANVAQHSVTRPSLTAKLTQLNFQTHHDISANNMTGHEAISAAKVNVMSVALWRHTAHVLYEPEASRLLRMLCLAKEQRGEKTSSPDEDLDIVHDDSLIEETPSEFDHFSDSDESNCSGHDDLLHPDGREDSLCDLDEHDDGSSDDWDWMLEIDNHSPGVLDMVFAGEDSFDPLPSHDSHDISYNTYDSEPWDACVNCYNHLECGGGGLDIEGRAQPDRRDNNPHSTTTVEEEMLDE